jgi:hypothetical protein
VAPRAVRNSAGLTGAKEPAGTVEAAEPVPAT